MWARKDNIISTINQSPESITINASKINLNGKVTFSMFSSSLQTTINDKLERENMGDLAFEDKVEFSKLGPTIISGNKIKTGLIDTDYIYANIAHIGDFSIESGNLVSNKMTIDSANGIYFQESSSIANTISRLGVYSVDPASGAGAYNLFLRNTTHSGSSLSNGACIGLEVGNPTGYRNAQAWISCSQASGWGAGFTVDARSFNEGGMSRTCIGVGQMATASQIKSLLGSGASMLGTVVVYSSGGKGYLCYE